jgi:DNA polymerase-3 subunit epsilon
MTPTPWYRNIVDGTDTESSGTNTRTARIVQWGAVRMLPNGQVYADVEHINPGEEILTSKEFQDASDNSHKITADHLRRYGNPPAESIRRYTQRLAESVAAKIPILGMNLPYDLALLHWECKRYDLPTLWELCGGEPAPIIDVYVLDKHVEPYRPGKRKLGDLCRRWKVPHGGEHDAVEDIKASARVGWKIAHMFQAEIGGADPFALHEHQKTWKRAQAASFQTYKRKTDPNAYIDPCWPACLDLTHPTD